MKKEQAEIEDPHQIIMDVRRKGQSQEKKKKKRGKLIETDIDLFADDNDEK